MPPVVEGHEARIEVSVEVGGTLRRAFAHVLQAVAITCLFDEGEFKSVHGIFTISQLGSSLQFVLFIGSCGEAKLQLLPVTHDFVLICLSPVRPGCCWLWWWVVWCRGGGGEDQGKQGGDYSANNPTASGKRGASPEFCSCAPTLGRRFEKHVSAAFRAPFLWIFECRNNGMVFRGHEFADPRYEILTVNYPNCMLLGQLPSLIRHFPGHQISLAESLMDH